MAHSADAFRAQVERSLSHVGLCAASVLAKYAEDYEAELDFCQLQEMLSEDHGGQMADRFVHAYMNMDKPCSFVGDHLWGLLCRFGSMATLIRQSYESRHGIDYLDDGFTDPQALASVAGEFLSSDMVASLLAEAEAALMLRDAMDLYDRDVPELEQWQALDREMQASYQSAPRWEDHFDNAREAGY